MTSIFHCGFNVCICSHMFSSSAYPSTGYVVFLVCTSLSRQSSYCFDSSSGLGDDSFSFGGGKSTSTVSLKASSIILGRRVLSRALVSSRHGLVFTSISHGLRYSSIMKSYPKISNECFLALGLRRPPSTHLNVVRMTGTIFSLSISWKSTSTWPYVFNNSFAYAKLSWFPSSSLP